jgi:hypothetical protein
MVFLIVKGGRGSFGDKVELQNFSNNAKLEMSGRVESQYEADDC